MDVGAYGLNTVAVTGLTSIIELSRKIITDGVSGESNAICRVRPHACFHSVFAQLTFEDFTHLYAS